MTSKYTFRLDSDIPGVEKRKVEITVNKGDEITYMALLDEFKLFLIAAGYDYLHGPLEFVEMEAEKTMRRLAADEPNHDQS